MQTVALLLLLLISVIFVGKTERLKYVYEFGHLCLLVEDIRIQSGKHLLSFLGHSGFLGLYPWPIPLNTELDPKCHAVELCFRDILYLSRIFCCSSISSLFLFVCLSLCLCVNHRLRKNDNSRDATTLQ